MTYWILNSQNSDVSQWIRTLSLSMTLQTLSLYFALSYRRSAPSQLPVGWDNLQQHPTPLRWRNTRTQKDSGLLMLTPCTDTADWSYKYLRSFSGCQHVKGCVFNSDFFISFVLSFFLSFLQRQVAPQRPQPLVPLWLWHLLKGAVWQGERLAWPASTWNIQSLSSLSLRTLGHMPR